MEKVELIDWSKRYPEEKPLDIAKRQSTHCLCGNEKEIGRIQCNNHCEKCGGELGSKIVGDESYNYCSDCNWIKN